MRSSTARKRESLTSNTSKSLSMKFPLKTPSTAKMSRKDWTPPKPTYSSYRPNMQKNLDEKDDCDDDDVDDDQTYLCNRDLGVTGTPILQSKGEIDRASISRFSPWSTSSSGTSSEDLIVTPTSKKTSLDGGPSEKSKRFSRPSFCDQTALQKRDTKRHSAAFGAAQNSQEYMDVDKVRWVSLFFSL